MGLGINSNKNSLDLYQTKVANIIGLSISVLSLLLGLISAFKPSFLVCLFTGLTTLALFLFNCRVSSRIVLLFGCSISVFLESVFYKHDFGIENYLICLSLLSLLLFSIKDKYWFLISMLVPLALFFFIKVTILSEGSSFPIHLGIALVLSAIIMYLSFGLHGRANSTAPVVVVANIDKESTLSAYNHNDISVVEGNPILAIENIQSFVHIYPCSYDSTQDRLTIDARFWDDYPFEKIQTVDTLFAFLKIVHKNQHHLFHRYFVSEDKSLPKYFSFEFQVTDRENHTIWLELKGERIPQGNSGAIIKGVVVDINSKKGLEGRLVESYTDLENILNYSPSGILITSNSKIEYVNDQFLKMVNMDRTELISSDTPFQLLPNENSLYLDFVNQDVKPMESSESQEFKLVRADNSHIDVLLSHQSIKYKGADANLLLISDYTLRRKFQSDLKEKEAISKINEELANSQKKLLEEILASLPLMLSIYDDKGNLYLNNKFMTEKYGWDSKDLKDLESLSKTVGDPVNNGLLLRSLSAPKDDWVTYKMVDKSGSEYLTEWACIKTYNNFLIRLGIDVSEKTKIRSDYELAIEQLQLLNQKLVAREERLASNQEQLRTANIKLYEQNKILEESENKFKLLSEASYEAVFMLEEGVIFDHNQSACKLLEFESNALNRIHISDLVVPSQRASILEILKNNSSVKNFDITFVKNTGRLFYGELQSKPFIYKGKNVLVFTVRDITYRKRIEIEAKNNEVNIRNLIDNINIGVYLKMSTGETFSNQTFVKIIGVDSLGGDFNFLEYVDAKNVEEVRNAMESIVKTENGVWTKDIVVRCLSDQGYSEVNVSLVNTTYKLKPALLVSIIDINKRKKAERELQVSYAYQNALLNSGDISYWAADKNFKLLFTNKYHELITQKYFNTKIEIGQDVRQEFKKIVDERDMEADFKSVLKGENITRVVRTHNDLGQNLWLEFNLSPIHIAGEITGILVRSKDVTSNFTQMERIRQSEERLREAQLLAKVGNWEESDDKTEVYWSTGLFKIFDLKPGFDPQMESLKALLGKDNESQFEMHYQEVLLSRLQVEKEYLLKNKDGNDKWLKVVIVKSIAKGGKSGKIKGTVQDITDSKLAEIQIKDNENLLNTIIDNLPVIFHMFDGNGLSLRINDELRKFFQLSNDTSPVGHYNVTKDIKLFGEEHIELVKNVFKGEKVSLKDIEVNLSNVKGRRGMEQAAGIKYLDSMFTPIFDHNGKIRTVIYLGINTTDVVLKSKELEKRHQEILEATRQVAEYKLIALRSAMNPHFLFNVLNSIQYFISKNDKGQALTHLSMFSKLVRKILESSMNNKISINEEVTMLKYYIDLENLRFDEKFEVVYNIDDTLLDEDVLIPSLIIQPYVENSILHGLLNKKDGQGRLEISIKDMDDYILCIIQDNGVGRLAASRLRDMDHKSLGTKVTEERLKIINKFDDISLKVVDLYHKNNKPAGTRTELKIKIN